MRILLVEDEKRMAQALCEILRLEKYEVDHYANGLDGLAAIESNVYDIVILDVMLPGMNGYEIAKRVRSQGITTPILMALLESNLPFEYITIMIQSEVADRLCAKAGSKEYGAITAVLKYYGEAQKLFKVSAGNFIPAPKVDSTVVRIKLHKEKPYVPKDEETLFKTIRAAFEQRRKTLPNALSAGFPDIPKETLTSIIEECGHRPDIRGERLDLADFVALADRIFRLRGQS